MSGGLSSRRGPRQVRPGAVPGRGHELEAARDVRQVAPRLRGVCAETSPGTIRIRSPLGYLPPGIPGSPAWSGPRASRSRAGSPRRPADRSRLEARSDRASEPPVPVVAPDRAPAARTGPQVGDAVVACAFNLLTPTAGPRRPPLRRSWFALRHSLPRGRFCRLPCGRGAMDRPRGLDTL